jgi:hypothetical protein
MPTYYGENAILRLLVSPGQKFNLENLGLSPRDLEDRNYFDFLKIVCIIISNKAWSN